MKIKEFIKYIYGIVYAGALIGIGISLISIVITVFTGSFKWYYLLVLSGFILINYICKIIYEKLFL